MLETALSVQPAPALSGGVGMAILQSPNKVFQGPNFAVKSWKLCRVSEYTKHQAPSY